jgi:hypothetical protein
VCIYEYTYIHSTTYNHTYAYILNVRECVDANGTRLAIEPHTKAAD